MTALLALFIFVILVIILFNPKLGTFLIWPILFTYPHGWWFHSGFLPLNIGYDDLFCIFLFLVVFFRKNIMNRMPIRTGYGFWIITVFVFIVAISAFMGRLNYPFEPAVNFVKEALKMVVLWCLFYAVLHCIDDEHDLLIQYVMFSIGAVLGATIIIFQYFLPDLMWPWLVPDVGTLTGRTATGTIEIGVEEGRRAYGAFRNANVAACIMACCATMTITVMLMLKKLSSKVLMYVVLLVIFIALFLTKSRSGFLAFGIAILLMAFLGERKKIAWLLIVGSIAIVGLMPNVRQDFKDRLAAIYDPTSRSVASNVQGRFETWKKYLTETNFKTYLLGQGSVSGTLQHETETHSAYVSLPTLYGAGGVLWGIIFIVGYLKRAFYVKRMSTRILKTTATGCLWALLVWMAYAFTADAISSTYPRIFLFYSVILIDRAWTMTIEWQTSQWSEYDLYASDVGVVS